MLLQLKFGFTHFAVFGQSTNNLSMIVEAVRDLCLGRGGWMVPSLGRQGALCKVAILHLARAFSPRQQHHSTTEGPIGL